MERAQKRRRAENSSRFKSAESNLAYSKGKQKYFAARYLQQPADGVIRQEFRKFIGADKNSATAPQKIVRAALNYYGPGDYRSTLKKWIPKGTFASAGRFLGGMSKIPGMSAVGHYAGDKFANFVGFGDYGSSVNQIVGGSNKGQISVNQSSMTGDIYITQTEFIQNISASYSGGGAGSSAFQQVQFPLNPGLSVTFPFLSQLAQNYALYEFEGLMFKYVPTSGENNATSNALGKVILATNYDPEASPFINSVQMENYDYANSAKPSMTVVHGVETANSQQALNMQYVRSGASTKNKIFTDIGTLTVATEGIPFAATGAQILGELWVSYRIKLSRAQLFGALVGLSINQDVITGRWPSHASGFTAVNKSSNQLGVIVAGVSNTTVSVTFPVNISLGSYQIQLYAQSGATVFTTQYPNLPTLGTNVVYWYPGQVLPQTAASAVQGPTIPVATTSNQGIIGITYITVAAPGLLQASLQLPMSAALSNTTTYTIIISQVNQNMGLTLV